METPTGIETDPGPCCDTCGKQRASKAAYEHFFKAVPHDVRDREASIMVGTALEKAGLCGCLELGRIPSPGPVGANLSGASELPNLDYYDKRK